MSMREKIHANKKKAHGIKQKYMRMCNIQKSNEMQMKKYMEIKKIHENKKNTCKKEKKYMQNRKKYMEI